MQCFINYKPSEINGMLFGECLKQWFSTFASWRPVKENHNHTTKTQGLVTQNWVALRGTGLKNLTPTRKKIQENLEMTQINFSSLSFLSSNN